MKGKSIKEKVIDKCKELGIPLVGFAPVDTLVQSAQRTSKQF